MDNKKILEGLNIAPVFDELKKLWYIRKTGGGIYADEFGVAFFVTPELAIASVTLDANFCERELKPFIRKLSYPAQAEFSKFLLNHATVSGIVWMDYWLAATPELILTAFTQYLDTKGT